jgi:hypothetical protein
MHHFYGFKSGLLLGLPAFHLPSEHTLYLYHRKVDSSALSYLRFFDSLLVVSSQAGRLHVFDFKHHKTLLRKLPRPSPQLETFLVNLDNLQVYEGLFSRPVAYSLSIMNEADLKAPLIVFLLDNKQLVLYNPAARAAFSLNIRNNHAHVYCLAALDDNFVVFTSESVEIVSREGLLREIPYGLANWQALVTRSHLAEDRPSVAHVFD